MTPEEEAPMPQMTRPDVTEALHAVHSALHSGEPCGDYLHEMVRLASETPVADRQYRRRLLGLAATPAPAAEHTLADCRRAVDAHIAKRARQIMNGVLPSPWVAPAAEPQEGEPSTEAPTFRDDFDQKRQLGTPYVRQRSGCAPTSSDYAVMTTGTVTSVNDSAAPAAEPAVTEALRHEQRIRNEYSDG